MKTIFLLFLFCFTLLAQDTTYTPQVETDNSTYKYNKYLYASNNSPITIGNDVISRGGLKIPMVYEVKVATVDTTYKPTVEEDNNSIRYNKYAYITNRKIVIIGNDTIPIGKLDIPIVYVLNSSTTDETDTTAFVRTTGTETSSANMTTSGNWTNSGTWAMTNYNKFLNFTLGSTGSDSVRVTTSAGRLLINPNGADVTLGSVLGTGSKNLYVSKLFNSASTIDIGGLATALYWDAGASRFWIGGLYARIGSDGLLVGDGTTGQPFLSRVGSVTNNHYGFLNDVNMGMYRIGADDMGFSTNGIKQFQISTTAITGFLPYTTANNITTSGSFISTSGSDNSTITGTGISVNGTGSSVSIASGSITSTSTELTASDGTGALLFVRSIVDNGTYFTITLSNNTTYDVVKNP